MLGFFSFLWSYTEKICCYYFYKLLFTNIYYLLFFCFSILFLPNIFVSCQFSRIHELVLMVLKSINNLLFVIQMYCYKRATTYLIGISVYIFWIPDLTYFHNNLNMYA